jgi:nucleotide-binding universal stress UspA family protein
MSASAGDRERIVAGVDGSPAAKAALRWAVEEAGRRASRLDAVIAWRPNPTIEPPAAHPPLSGCGPPSRREDAETELDLALGEIDVAGVEIERRVMRGSPHRVLLEAAEGASMVVVGGRSGKLAGKLPWSTGQQVVLDAPCPVVVVPPAAARTRRGDRREPGERSAGPAAGVAGGGVLPG